MGSQGCDTGGRETTENTENTERGLASCSLIVLALSSGMVELERDPLLYREDAFRIRGAVFDVYRAMGAGFLEAVYQECLTIEFAKRGIPFEAAKALTLQYRGHPLRQSYVADFVCNGRIIIELKAVRVIAPEHRAQIINYLRATDMKLGLLVNFGASPRAEIERFAL